MKIRANITLAAVMRIAAFFPGTFILSGCALLTTPPTADQLQKASAAQASPGAARSTAGRIAELQRAGLSRGDAQTVAERTVYVGVR